MPAQSQAKDRPGPADNLIDEAAWQSVGSSRSPPFQEADAGGAIRPVKRVTASCVGKAWIGIAPGTDWLDGSTEGPIGPPVADGIPQTAKQAK
jgi:hypothetical protein